MHITHSFGHVNDLANIKAKDKALKDALDWVRHWQRDVAEGLKPTPDSLAMVEARLSSALGAAR